MKKGGETVDDMLADFSDDGDEDDDLMNSSNTNTNSNAVSASNQHNTNSNGLMWHYRWKHDTSTTHGPFSSQQMMDWNDLYFKAQPVQFKRVGASLWKCSDQVDLLSVVRSIS